MSAPTRRKPTLRERDPSDPLRRVVELAQRGRMILEVSTIDLEAAEVVLGSFHPTTWHFRHALNEAKRSWDRLRAEFGGATLEEALKEAPLMVLTLGDEGGDLPRAVLIPIGGRAYEVARVEGTEIAPVQWRINRLTPALEHGPYYVCRLQDGSTQCDCAEWTYRLDTTDPHFACKHLAALAALGWI